VYLFTEKGGGKKKGGLLGRQPNNLLALHAPYGEEGVLIRGRGEKAARAAILARAVEKRGDAQERKGKRLRDRRREGGKATSINARHGRGQGDEEVSKNLSSSLS